MFNVYRFFSFLAFYGQWIGKYSSWIPTKIPKSISADASFLMILKLKTPPMVMLVSFSHLMGTFFGMISELGCNQYIIDYECMCNAFVNIFSICGCALCNMQSGCV